MSQPDFPTLFAAAWRAAAEPTPRRVMIITPSGALVGADCPIASRIPPDAVAAIRTLLPADAPPARIAVIGDVGEAVDVRSLLSGVPMFGHLLALGALGHAVVLYNGDLAANASAAGGANLVLIDGGMIELQGRSWEQATLRKLRGCDVVVIDRDGTTRWLQSA